MQQERVSEEVRAAAEKLVRDAMGRFGLKDVRITAGEDHDGDPVIYVDADYADEGDPVDTRIVVRLISEVSSKLISLGEQRFPHIRHHFADDQQVAGE